MQGTATDSNRIGRLLLWLSMLAATGVCAAGTYEHVVIVPEWIKDPPSSIGMFHGPYAIDTGRWWRVVHAPTVLICLGAFLLLRGHPRRPHVASAAIGYLVLLAITAGWILPELLALTSDPAAPIPPAEWQVRAQRWELVSLVRLAVMYVNAALLTYAASVE